MDMGSPPKKRLGRGLAALIGEDTSEESVVQDVRSLRHMPIDLLKASPNNPRKTFAEVDLEDLSKSIRDKGLLQPDHVAPTASLFPAAAQTALASESASLAWLTLQDRARRLNLGPSDSRDALLVDSPVVGAARALLG